MQHTRVGIREFRENLAAYLFSSKPVTITRHGETVGFYVPARPRPSKDAVDAFWQAGEKLRASLDAAGVTEEDIIADLEELDRQRKARS